MSIAEFSAAMRNRAIKQWFDLEVSGGGSASKASQEKYRAENINTIVNATSDYRSAEQTAEKTAFIITKDTIHDLLVDFKGMEPGSLEIIEAVNKIFTKFKSKGGGVKVNRRVITVGKDLPAVYFSNISFDSITTLVNNILELDPAQLSTKYEKGHVVGLNTELLRITAGRISGIDARAAAGAVEAKQVILRELEKVIEYYKRLDYESANIKPAQDVAVYASVNKTISRTGKTKYLVELQPKAANQISAKEVKATIGSIRKLFSPNNLTEAAMTKLVDKIRESVSDPTFSNDLMNLKSSPSYLEMIAKHVADSIKGDAKEQAFNVAPTNIGSQPVPKVDLKELRKVIAVEQAKVTKLKKKLSSGPKANKVLPGMTISNLTSLLQARLPDQIKLNMGTGNAKNILNYRTGRFAESASIERATISREGMVSVFYNYMRNPYGTFSDGGKQQYPRSRDPKLLISKSIREIGASLSFNRMRAILV